MKKLITIYDKITVNSITYEKGDIDAQISCDLYFKNKTISTKLIITQSDLNRLMSKIIAQGFEIKSEDISSFFIGNETEVIEYDFKSNCYSIHDFNFNHSYTQIGA